MSTVGIDPSVQAPAIAVWPSGDTWQARVHGEGAERLCALYDAVHDWAALSAPDDLEAVFIERPVGKFPKRSLDHATGVIQVAMVHGLKDIFPFSVSVFELSPGTWKKAALGKGNAKKHEVIEWAAEHLGSRNYTSDEADALAIGCAGFRMLNDKESK